MYLVHKYLISCSPWAPHVRPARYYNPKYSSHHLLVSLNGIEFVCGVQRHARQLCGEAGKICAPKVVTRSIVIFFAMLGLKT